MNIIFRTHKIEKEFNARDLLVRRHGPRRAGLIELRLVQMRAANALKDMRTMPQARCHELNGNLAGVLSVDLDHPYRLVFQPANDPVPRKSDGGLDWTRITAIMILGVEDTHG